MLKTFTIRQQTSKIVSLYGCNNIIVSVDEFKERYFFDIFRKKGMQLEEMKLISHDNNSNSLISNNKLVNNNNMEAKKEGKPTKLLLEGMAGEDYVYSLYSDHVLRFTDIKDYETVLFEMPVNVLNFSNILVIPLDKDDNNQKSCFHIVTVSTTDPDCFDVYFVDILETKNFNRLLKQVKFTEKEYHFGNIMQFSYINDINSIAVGYEDGSVCVFRMNENFNEIETNECILYFKDEYEKKLKEETECDHPILCFEYFPKKTTLFMGHAKSSCIFTYNFSDKKIDKLKFDNIFSVSNISNLNETDVLFSTWETGNLYKLDTIGSDPLLEIIYNIPEKPNIQMVDIDPTGDTTMAQPFKEAQRDYNKITYLKVISKEQLQKSYLNKTSKVLLKRYSQVIGHDHVAIGLQSGVVIIIQL
ncbi:hypothetical protein ACO0SA_003753 [Hanseniaspora valbyensis]